VAIASPFITPYLLTELGFSYSRYTILIAASFLAKILTLPAWGRVAARRGPTGLLRLGGLGVMILPAFWLVSTDFVFLLVLQVFAGITWAALELASFLLMFDASGDDERTSLLVHFNFANAVATVSGSVLGGVLFRTLGEGLPAYQALWAVSTIARLAAALLVFRVAGLGAPAVRILARTIALRPWTTLDLPLPTGVWRGRRRGPRPPPQVK
jgi:MFS family permease